ncbi:MAG: beta-propeller domain-containing protein [Dehalococcoidia bacterium]|nr:beta-propeller domain-containing protein [Dehalococcoidia bacterium]
MKHEDLINKLENLETPDIELLGHRQALKTALLGSRRFRSRTFTDWAKVLVPVTAAVVLIAVLGLLNVMQPVDHQMSRFASYDELTEFININTKSRPILFSTARMEMDAVAFTPAPGPVFSLITGSSAPVEYSTTNIQVAGVDEADIVKTDGEYIYLASGSTIFIVKAYPPEDAQVLAEIELQGRPLGLFINGDRLVVIEGVPTYYRISGMPSEVELSYVSGTSIGVYDISDRQGPFLSRELSSDGNYVSSRMIGDYVYVVVNESVYDQDGAVRLPVVSVDGQESEISPDAVYYYDAYDRYYTYTSIIALHTQDDDREPVIETILLGASSTLYVSEENIYLTFPVWGGGTWHSRQTSIHRISINGDQMEYAAGGEVPGKVLNQFSMDEYDGYFRVATNTNPGSMLSLRLFLDELFNSLDVLTEAEFAPSLNHVYILDMDLKVVGSVQDLAPGERIHSARFMGEKGYLVTFKKIDPLFVIDLADPRNPQVLGELKITGYSDYLHPYDENHLIGIGKEAVEAEEGDFAWFQGVKISLFDVSDVSNPLEIATCEIGHRGTDSPVLRDHKALLFDRSRNLMVLPVLVAEIDEAKYSGRVPAQAWGEPVWQGAYVFHVSPDQGISLEGGITHIESPDQLPQRYYGTASPFSVQRSLYIGDVLYTISEAMIKMNDLATLDYINEVELS